MFPQLGVIAAVVFAQQPAQQPPLRTEIVVDAPIEEVWAAWTTETGLESWLAQSAQVELWPGGRYSTNSSGKISEPGTINLKILAFDPQRVLCFTKTAPADEFPAVGASGGLWAVITLTSLDDAQTLVQQSTLGLREGEEWDQARIFFKQSDRYVLEMLRRRFAGQHTPLIPRIRATRTLSNEIDVAAPPDVAWQTLTTPRGLASWLGAEATVDLSIGGSIAYSTAPGAEPIVERILAFDPQRVLATRYDLPEGLESVLGVVEQTWTVTRLEPTVTGGTRITRTMLGWENGREWDEAYRFFDTQNAQQMRALSKLLGRAAPVGAESVAEHDETAPSPEQDAQPGRLVLERLATLAGNWTAVVDRPNGGRMLVRSSFRLGPDGLSIVSSTHMADRERETEHMAGLTWLEPETHTAEFISIDELGQVARGSVTRMGDELVWDWRVSTETGIKRLEVRITLTDADHYRMVVRESNAARPLVDSEFTRDVEGSGD